MGSFTKDGNQKESLNSDKAGRLTGLVRSGLDDRSQTFDGNDDTLSSALIEIKVQDPSIWVYFPKNSGFNPTIGGFYADHGGFFPLYASEKLSGVGIYPRKKGFYSLLMYTHRRISRRVPTTRRRCSTTR
jgi:hypothetical protein